MAVSNAVREGWEFTSKYSGAALGAAEGAAYVNEVEKAIQALNEHINDFSTNGAAEDKLKGFIAEAWHADTFNIQAALRDSASRAVRGKSTKHASADVMVTAADGSQLPFSMKYYASGGGARGSAAMQAKNVIEAYHEYLSRSKAKTPMTFDEYIAKYNYPDDTNALLRSVYYGQGRIIPSDQMKEAIAYLQRKMNEEIGKEGPNRAAVYQNYKETLEKLSDRVQDGSGVESIPLTKEEAEVIAALSKEEGFDAANFGISLDLITREYIMRQALKAGYTSAVITLVLQIAPEIYKALDYLIQNGEIDADQLKRSGLKALSASATGFIRGSVSCGLTIACQAGKLGNAFTSASAPVIGAVTALVMDTMSYSFHVARGTMTPREMGAALTKEIVVSAAAIGGGLALQPFVPVMGYLLGSFLGSVIAGAAMEVGEHVFLSFCADSGFTCFGLVEQDYRLPPDILEYIGIDVIDINQKELSCREVQRKKIGQVQIQQKSFNTIKIAVLRRGVVGVHKIAYVT